MLYVVLIGGCVVSISVLLALIFRAYPSRWDATHRYIDGFSVYLLILLMLAILFLFSRLWQ